MIIKNTLLVIILQFKITLKITKIIDKRLEIRNKGKILKEHLVPIAKK